ncbi:MAG: NPCBM/NEW2 domain-containing protein [Bacteroidales bacterium]|nr:NPCBM/NEW2 domain-containing protein [Bacteroidales bacterium]
MKKLIRNFCLLFFAVWFSSCSSIDTIYLDQMDLSDMSSGWRSPQLKKSVTENHLLINGNEFANGVGTHATSTFLIDLKGDAKTFTAYVGVDDASDKPASIKFFVLGDGEILWESQIMKWGMEAELCEVSLKKVQKLGLLVTDAGDGISHDHANWADAQIAFIGTTPLPTEMITEESYILTPPAPDKPRINGPAIVGARPGSPVLYRIPATGKEPIDFDIADLPAGLNYQSGSRIISGSIAIAGDYTFTITAKNESGSDSQDLTFRIGDTLALTPHMGWNSWYIHYDRVSDKIMREAADQMIATGMADYGYRYVNIDDCWMIKEKSDDPEIGGSLRDSYDVLNTNKRFPDMKDMTDYIHDQGLLAGTYISPGPFTCARYAGSFEHEALDAKTFAEWGFDFLKYDWCSYGRVKPAETRDDYVAPYKLMWNELKKQNRDIVFNLCQYGMDQVWEWGGDVGNSWRTTGDLGLNNAGSMPGFYGIGRSNAEHWQYAKPGNWNDPDYILIGWVGAAQGMGEGVPTDLLPSEQYAYMSMWSLMASPLIFSGDMAKLDAFTLNVLCNNEVIAVNQDVLGKQGEIIREGNGEMIMVKELDDGSKAVGLFHVTDNSGSPSGYFNWGGTAPHKIRVSAEELGIQGPFKVRDLWRQKDLGEFDNAIELEVPWHGVQMLQISSKLASSSHNLIYKQLATSWDEAIPLGNGELGALIWNRDGNLRFSLDRVDLWDQRSISWLEKEEFRFDWVYKKWQEDDYGVVQEFFDKGAYSNSIAPSKIPGAALEFVFEGASEVISAELDVQTATAIVKWTNGLKLEAFVQADEATGWFKMKNIPEDLKLDLIPPRYESDTNSGNVDEVTGQDLRLLGYKQGEVHADENSLRYHQVGYGGFYYDVVVKWKRKGDELVGNWSLSSSISDDKNNPDADQLTAKMKYRNALKSHLQWWNKFWSKSGISIPDPVLEKQWYLEQYKFGSAARAHTPPISLQAVWTADNGKMPPWKGDFHHDLNTQLSYWPAYSANHLDLEIGFLNWLWDIKPVANAYTKEFFGKNGLNVPGVTTLSGKPMGGWIQYSCGPTVSAWLGQHFYLHWRYSMDREFLKDRAYPWISEVAIFLDEFSVRREDGLRKLPLSSSPEIHDNSRSAWFSETTNFDLGLIRFTFEKAAELATELGLSDDVAKWEGILAEWPRFSVDSSGLKFAPSEAYSESHRHFSHLVAWHPLGILDVSKSDEDKETISNTLRTLEKYGTDWWVGYSYAWQGNLYARNFDGENAAQALRDFANCFCLPNTFHVNGDQTKSGMSKFQYRPFTLEGNFAFAAGIQEMLIQSHSGVVRVFPAIPGDWQNVEFKQFRTEGGFLISAKLADGELEYLEVEATVDGQLTLYYGSGLELIVDQWFESGEVKSF